MTPAQFKESITQAAPQSDLSPLLQALWWDAKGNWTHAHSLVDHLDTPESMAVHAYLHRREGDAGNAAYWYKRSGAHLRRPTLDAEWAALVDTLLAQGRTE